MKSTLWTAPTELEWRQSSAVRSEYGLWEGESQVAHLRINGTFHSTVKAESVVGAWDIESRGFWKHQVVVFESARRVQVATYVPETWATAGLVTMANGSGFRWSQTSAWKGTYAVHDAAGSSLLQITLGLGRGKSGVSDWFKTQARVRLDPGRNGREAVALLTLVSWYLVIASQEADGVVIATFT